jgi:hypothetical protein
MTAIYYVGLVMLIFQAPLSVAEIYSWVDEKGKTHYGDKIPQQYRDSSQEVDVKKPNGYEKTISPPPPKSPTAIIEPHPPKKQKRQPAKKKSEQLTCEEKYQAFKAQEKCFSSCPNWLRITYRQRTKTMVKEMPNPRYEECLKRKECKDIKYPECKLE